ncbi:MAG TPA: class I SAM-dependent methyltransferase [Streptosporangiaceae bacterium]
MQNRSGNTGYDNSTLAKSGKAIDPINSSFYDQFPYPWPPLIVRKLADPRFELDFLSQSIGRWDHSALPLNPRIWIAGCGTNQAALTAVEFPTSAVTASDLSVKALDSERRLAEQLGVTNLDLRQESINDAEYYDEFDYVICTGVIHHNEDPRASLARLASSLKPDGLIQLMVYNRYHSIEANAVQNVIRILADDDSALGLDRQLALATTLMKEHEDLRARIARFFEMDYSESALADALIQPVSHTFTVLELQRIAEDCGLDLAQPFINQFDVARNCLDWTMQIHESELQDVYSKLGDAQRWQVTNLLKLEQSPMLWFFLRRSSSAVPRKTEREITDEFLNQAFEVSATASQVFCRTPQGTYQVPKHSVPYPGPHPDTTCRKLVALVADRKRARPRDLLTELSIPADFPTVSGLRQRLTTGAFPYLRSV